MNQPAIHNSPLSYEARLTPRKADAITLVVIHCTELPDLETAREYGEKIHYPDSGTGNSGHFYIDRDGRIELWIDPLQVAHHVAGHNENSIGIELVNLGRYPDWFNSDSQDMNEAYPGVQIDALVSLLEHLTGAFPGLCSIAAHEDLDNRQVAATDNPDELVRRKMDPGPLFPWDSVLAATRLARINQL